MARHLGMGSPECERALAKAAAWALTCWNTDGGFGHFPAEPLPKDAHLLGWGHLFAPP